MRKPIGKIKDKSDARRVRRKLSIRKKIAGTSERPRICPTKSNKHLRVQIIDDNVAKTLFSFQTFGKDFSVEKVKMVEKAKILGVKVAEMLKQNKIERAVFDRNGYKFTGIISALVGTIREKGISI